ncbi:MULTISPECIES: helix-turn-helix transcriptional regulator [Methylophaga]|uniref:Helix-turn-helix domain protein n=1 Tax=Methylophaga muralis TaxID=291169 RepID=A0A1E3GNK8_9GAMM|nr:MULTISPECIES: helix-turn-helix transcriptional regulator [Methylophaga]ODN65633.1 Helix-turn-helix domain protein [Methylophaga muralis]THK40551.1 helix-turn-helix domain-containing protein [Methylophaga sp. SB9B]
MNLKDKSANAITEELGERLKQARLNANLTQLALAEQAGVSRKVVLNAEKGKVQLHALVAMMQVLGLTQQLDNFLPKQALSPIQLAKLQGKQRQRASGQGKTQDEDGSEW